MIILLISYSELTEKFISLFSERYNTPHEEVVEFIKRSDIYVLASYIQDFWSISPIKEAYRYAEIIKEDVLNSPKEKNPPNINVSYINCGSTTQRWQWGNDNGGPACTGANRCWGTILNGNYPPNMEDTLYSPIINASGYSSIVLRFRQWYYTENNFDQGFILCSPNGGNNWYSVAGPIQGNSNGWINTNLNLPPQCQNTSQLRIAFRFKSDGSIQYYGWYVDDVVIENQTLSGTTILYASSFEENDGDLSIVNIGGSAPWQRGAPTSGPNSAYHGQEVW
ncbi:MAG: immune inhibitor A, partial [candidate division WOR-3 bacterium]|nr:immune inhibitor A [candidate division WOR-3 bacterium]